MAALSHLFPKRRFSRDGRKPPRCPGGCEALNLSRKSGSERASALAASCPRKRKQDGRKQAQHHGRTRDKISRANAGRAANRSTRAASKRSGPTQARHRHHQQHIQAQRQAAENPKRCGPVRALRVERNVHQKAEPHISGCRKKSAPHRSNCGVRPIKRRPSAQHQLQGHTPSYRNRPRRVNRAPRKGVRKGQQQTAGPPCQSHSHRRAGLPPVPAIGAS